MNWCKEDDGDIHIYLDNSEDERNVLRAIAKASFETARPAGMGFLHFNAATSLTDEIVDRLISPNGVQMDYVEGRQCKTFIRKVDVGHFTMNAYLYERDRGNVDAMLESAVANCSDIM